jgi:hypothetical protein
LNFISEQKPKVCRGPFNEHSCTFIGWSSTNFRFFFDMKFKVAATAGLSLTLDSMWKMFQNASLKPHGQLKPNCPGIIMRHFFHRVQC